MKTFAQILKDAPDIKVVLKNHNRYQAHIHDSKIAEPLHEHVELVNNYAAALVKAHGLDWVINKLITACTANWKEGDMAAAKVKEFFVHSIVFHDFGKINEHFQVLRMKNNSPFPSLPAPVLKPPHGHSFLGTFIFLCYHIQSIIDSTLPDEIKSKLVCVSFFLAYPILQHHSPVLVDVTEKESYMVQFKPYLEPLQRYLQEYGIKTNQPVVTGVFTNIDQIWNGVSRSFTELESFPFYALIKLNFSLLTAADYLATHEYMQSTNEVSATITDFGIFDSRQRVEAMIQHIQDHSHNAATFSSLSNFNFLFPTEKSNKNLNQLRQQMAVSVIQTVRENTDKKLFYIEAPTGGGKTNLSILSVAELMQANPEINKVFYVFPFTTLITQTYGVVKQSLRLQDSEIIEMHSKAGLGTGEEKSEDFKDGLYGGDKKDYIDNLFALYPVTLLSHVKFFNILKTNRKEDNYLLHRLANSIVVVDEIQSYNPAIWDKMLFFISQYAKYFNIRFILMSATLPKISNLNIGLSQQPDFIDLLPEARRYITNKNFAERVSFNFDLFNDKITIEDLASKLIDISEDYSTRQGSVKTIIEFIYKKSASTFKQLIEQKIHPFDEIFVLSGTVLEPRRKEIINYIKRSAGSSQNILLITTQVVEAGVDIDMDLGFKNVSLIDSDEQLAGRVNRNAFKTGCEVYLFKLDDAKILYGKDFRFAQTREHISATDYQDILNTKDFTRLYEKVLHFIDDNNKAIYKDAFLSYEENFQKLKFKDVDSGFKIIDQNTESVFVPLPLPVNIAGIKTETSEAIFSQKELQFLNRFGVIPNTQNYIQGEKVWQVYEHLIDAGKANRKSGKGFDIMGKIDFKSLQSIMAKFTFSLLGFSKDYLNIRLLGEERYGYLYFSYWNDDRTEGKPYSYEDGLNNKAFSDANFI